MTQPPAQLDPIAFFENWKNLPHQRAAVIQMWEKLPETERSTAAEWYQTWKAAGKQSQPRQLANPLQVPYFSQRDSATEHAMRMCFSSSCAMMLEALRPGTLQGPNGDDRYLGRVLRYGDTTDAQAQIKALESFGLRTTIRQDCSVADVVEQIERGIPVPLGIIHKGPVSRPQGDGHWICAIGYTADAFIVHDPFGELDLVNGGYINNWGSRLRYSISNLSRRWEVVPDGATYRHVPGNGWAIIAQP